MKTRRLVMMMAIVAMVTGVMASAQAGGPSNTNLADHGWGCDSAGPNDYVHCFSPGSFKGKTATVKVFDSTDATVDGNYLGTELLISADVYNGQPCASDDGHEYHPLFPGPPNIPFYACHHYGTSS